MEYIAWYFFSVIFICLFCLGWRTITDKGQILYFLRKPYETKQNGKEQYSYEQWNKLSEEEKKGFVHGKIDKTMIFIRPTYYIAPKIMKPIILCVTCMPSFWGTLLYIGLSVFVLPKMIDGYKLSTIVFMYLPVLLSSSFINSIAWKLNSE